MLGLGVLIGAILRAVLPRGKSVAAVVIVAPFLFVLDRYSAPISYQTSGYRQIFGAGAGIYLSLLATGFLGRPRMRLSTPDIAIGLLFLLLALSVVFPNAGDQALAMFLSNTLPLVGAYFAARRVEKKDTDLVLDAIIFACVVAVLARWTIEGVGVSDDPYRAGTNWYLGGAVYSGLPMQIAWGLALPGLYRLSSAGSLLIRSMRILAFLALSAELMFMQRKTFLVTLLVCGLVFIRLGKRSSRRGLSRMSARKLIGSALLLIVLSFTYLFLEVRITRLYDSFWGNASDVYRLESMGEHFRAVMQSPFGFGFDGLFTSALPATSAKTAHNVLIDLAGDAGFLASISFAALMAVSISLVVRAGRTVQPPRREWNTWSRLALGGAAAMCELVINAPTFYREYPIPSSVLAVVFLGTMVSWCLNRLETQRSEVGRDRSDPPLKPATSLS